MVATNLKLLTLSEIKSASVPSNQHSSTTGSNANSSFVRAKCDPAWDHVTEELKDGKSSYGCVPYDVRFQMVENLKEISKSKEQTKKDQETFKYSPLEDSPKFEDVQEIPPKGRGLGRGNRSGPSGFPLRSNLGKRKVDDIGNYFAPRTTPRAQPSINSVLVGKEKKWRVDMAVARWMYDACIPINAMNPSYYQPIFNAVASYSRGYRGLNYHALRVPSLREAKREVQLIVDSHRSYSANISCTIMADGWTYTRYKTLINFLVYCPKGIIFIHFVDTFNLVKDAINLSNLFDEIVNWVGPANIVHLVIDNTTNYVAARRIFCGKYRNISWLPCVAHCLNVIFKEIGKMDHVAKLTKRASKITVFIYNQVALQAWLRTRKNWMEIVRLGPTRLATTFIALQSLKEHKHDLQALMTSKFYVESRYAKDKKAKAVVKIILDNQFWNDCHVIVHIMSPLIRLLRIVDSNEKPTMGYVYKGTYRVIDGIKKNFKDKKRLWEPYVNIIKDRWDNQFYRDIHAVSYWLNPAFQYDSSTFNKRLETQSAMTDVIESNVSASRLKLVEELRLFREREQTFETQLAQESAKTSQSNEWWKLFGFCAPTLQKFAIRILSQIASSSRCERNWSVFEQIHTKKRNRLELQRLNDLVVKRKKFNFDPIDYVSIDKIEFWVVEDEKPPFLDHEEIENALYEEGVYPIEEGCSIHVQRDMDNEVIEDNDDINLESFGDEDDAPPGFRHKKHPIHVEHEEDEDEDEDDDNDASGGAFGSHNDIDFNFLHNT
ncbi:hypothetical protein SO802_023243 [Lithocarpus litseifolius]|uniref:DUF659 domain-containing protein n=1 Tax=Lithocarpus litseifolius TaxID=425828 RepID=A0AAW2CB81_9ROSI